MDKSIFIVGTYHGYQSHSDEFKEAAHDKFRDLLNSLIKENSIKLLSEEASTEALKEWDVKESVCQHVARNCNIEHIFTEALLSYRNQHGMQHESTIKQNGFSKNWNQTKIIQEIELSYRKREEYWLQEILKANIWPVLHVCGTDHATQFQSLVTRKNINGVLVHECWNN